MLIPPALMFHNISSSEDTWTTEPQQWTGVPSKAINYDRKLELNNKIYLLHRHPVQQEQPACNTSKHKSSCSKGHTLATLILLELNAGTELLPLMEHTHNATASISSVMRVNLLFDLCHIELGSCLKKARIGLQQKIIHVFLACCRVILFIVIDFDFRFLSVECYQHHCDLIVQRQSHNTLSY